MDRIFSGTFPMAEANKSSNEAASALPRDRFALLFAVMLVAAAGNTAMQSLMPSIGRNLGIADLWVAVAFSLSAVLWVVAAPHWARRADHRGRRALMRLGLYGFIASMLICGIVAAAGLHGWLAPGIVFIIFSLGRGIYGWWGSASPPGVQAYVAARTEGEQRTNALAAIASSFGLGTIIGPAIAPLFVFEPLGLAGPLIVFALIGMVVLAALILHLPDDTPKRPARGQVVDYPTMGGVNTQAPLVEEVQASAKLSWNDRRILPWNIIGVVGGHGYAALLGVIGFLVIDRLSLQPEHAQQSIAIVLMAGAVATLLAQWWLIPQLHLSPASLVLWGSLLAAVGSALTGVVDGVYGITMSFALASLGFGLYRPGFTGGASLSVAPHEQNAAAGMVTSVNGLPYIVGPAVGVALYGLWMPLPFLLTGALMVALAFWVSLRFRPSSPAA
ncbi:MAG TPA: MFS transporter [Allosphingosinicella sp.]|uniref:MFS transporter n=1 Tax=Allosphingosinicella sp. TaxID=2823234 RepID=UPI002ED860DC